MTTMTTTTPDTYVSPYLRDASRVPLAFLEELYAWRFIRPQRLRDEFNSWCRTRNMRSDDFGFNTWKEIYVAEVHENAWMYAEHLDEALDEWNTLIWTASSLAWRRGAPAVGSREALDERGGIIIYTHPEDVDGPLLVQFGTYSDAPSYQTTRHTVESVWRDLEIFHGAQDA